jgi:hypothetical protein
LDLRHRLAACDRLHQIAVLTGEGAAQAVVLAAEGRRRNLDYQSKSSPRKSDLRSCELAQNQTFRAVLEHRSAADDRSSEAEVR